MVYPRRLIYCSGQIKTLMLFSFSTYGKTANTCRILRMNVNNGLSLHDMWFGGLGFVPCSSKTLISPYRTIQHQFLVPQSGCVVKLRGSELVLCGLWNKLCRDASANFLICCCNVGYPGIYRAHVIYEDVLWFVIRWWLELLHHFEVTGLCLKHIMATKIIILEITMNTKDFSAPVLPTQGVLNSHKCFRGTVLHIYTCHCGSWFCFCLQSALWI
jgi:hypothetical protein